MIKEVVHGGCGMSYKRGRPGLPLLQNLGRIGGIAGLAIAGVGISNSLFNVDGGYRAIVWSRLGGIKQKVYNEGTHLIVPWIERPIVFDVRAKPRNIASLTGTKDLQMVNISLRVLSKPDIQNLTEIYRTLGADYDERVLPSIVNEVLKSVVAQFNASQLVTQREKVSRLVRQRLTERASNFNIVLDDVSITSVQFSEEFSKAVEAKQIAQQDAQRSAFIVERAKQERQSIILRAEGEAQAAKLIGEAIQKNPAFLNLRRIEAARDISHIVAGGANKIFLNSDSLLLNLAENSFKPI